MTDGDARPPIAACASFVDDGPSPLHDLVRRLRAGDTDALQAAVDLVAGALREGLPGLPHVRAPAIADDTDPPPRTPAFAVAAVTVPGHRAGTANVACERVLERLALTIPWLRPSPGALVRVADAAEGKRGGTRDPSGEAATLAWRAERLRSDDGPILLLDDVVRSGASIEAAITAAPAAVGSRIVPLAVFRATDPVRPG